MAIPALAAGLAKGLAKGAITKSVTGAGKKGAIRKSFQTKPSERKEEGRGLVRTAPGASPRSSAIVAFSPSVTGNPEKKIASVSGGDPKLIRVEKIRVSVVNIESYFKTRIKSKADIAKKRTKLIEKQKGNKGEDEREVKKTGKKTKGLKLPKPKSFFERILSGIATMIGYGLLMRLLPFVDQLKPILMGVINALKFILDIGGKILNGLITFVSWGMDAYDATVGWIGDTFGEDALNAVTSISDKLVHLINAAIIVGSAMLAMDMNPFNRGNKNKPGVKPTKPTLKPTQPKVKPPGMSPTGRPRPAASIQRKFGHNAANAFQAKYDKAIQAGRTPTQALTTGKAHVRKLIESGKITAAPQTGSLGGGKAGSKIFKGGIAKSANRFGIKLFGKSAMKGVSKMFGRIPIVGPLIIAVASILAGEGIGKALFKGVGAALGGLLGSFIPIPVLGTILGELVGEYVGDLMHVLIMGGGISKLGERLQSDIAAALNVAGAAFNFLKDGAVRFFENFPTVDVPDIRPGKIFADMLSINPIFKAMMNFEVKIPKGIANSNHFLIDRLPLPEEWKTALKEGFSLRGVFDSMPGIQEILGSFAKFIPGMDKFIKNGALKKVPNLLLLSPPGLPFLLPHVGKSFLPGVFGGSSTSKAPKTPKESPPADNEGAGEEKGFFSKIGDGLGGMMSGISNMFGGGGSDENPGGRTQVPVTSLGSGGGSLKDMTDQDFSDLAFIVSHEAARNTDDEYGVAAAVLNRVADPRYPNTIMGVGTAPGQFEAVFKGLAKRDPALANKLKENQDKIVEALKKLNGRTDFKGQTMLKYMGDTDVMFHKKGNFYHYAEQRGKTDPIPTNLPKDWKKLIGESTGGDFGGGSTTTTMETVDTSMDTAASLGRAATPDNSDAKAEQAQKQSGGSGGITPSPGQQAQLSTASSGAVAASRARNISQMTEYEKISSGMKQPSSMFIPMPIGGPGSGGGNRGGSDGGGNVGARTGLNKKESIEAFYKAQLLGFLQRQ